MTKPWWDEEWLLSAEDHESGPVIGLKGGGVLFDCNDATRARGAHAAPDMARALLMVLEAAPWGEYSDEVQTIRDALNKAGVPLP
jgi:hypothetical protein